MSQIPHPPQTYLARRPRCHAPNRGLVNNHYQSFHDVGNSAGAQRPSSRREIDPRLFRQSKKAPKKYPQLDKTFAENVFRLMLLI